eukprot:810950-Alexandrium_andersonii.AAC.1
MCSSRALPGLLLGSPELPGALPVLHVCCSELFGTPWSSLSLSLSLSEAPSGPLWSSLELSGAYAKPSDALWSPLMPSRSLSGALWIPLWSSLELHGALWSSL